MKYLDNIIIKIISLCTKNYEKNEKKFKHSFIEIIETITILFLCKFFLSRKVFFNFKVKVMRRILSESLDDILSIFLIVCNDLFEHISIQYLYQFDIISSQKEE